MYYFGPAQLTREYFMDRLVDSPPPVVAVDCETISLDERMPIGFSIATTPDESFYFQTFPEPDPALHYLSRVLTDPTIKKVFHNAPFDLRNIPLAVPIEMSNIADTNVMARLLGEQETSLYLLAITVNKETTPVKELLAKAGKGSTMLDLPVETVAKHCADDSRCTLALYHHYLPHINSTYFAVEMAVIPILIQMGLRGVKFNESDRAEIEVKLENDLAYYGNMIKSLGVDNPNSGQQVGFILAKRGNFLPLTKSRKQLKTDEDTLEFIDDPLAQIVLSYKHNNTLLTKYIWPMKGQDRVYTEYNLDARVGRISSSKMNLQNLPGKNPTRPRVEHYNIRNIIVPDNGVYTTGDYCLSPNTLILKSDLTWERIDNLHEGDILIGVDEFPVLGRGKRRKMLPSEVIRVGRVVRQSYKMTLSNGVEVVSSAEHPWLELSNNIYKHPDWKETRQLKVGDLIRQLGKPWSSVEGRDAGYIAGILDGEGWVDSYYHMVGFAQNEGELLDYILFILENLGISPKKKNGSNSTTQQYAWTKLYDMLKVMGSIRPHRLMSSSQSLWNGYELPKDNAWVEVTSIQPIGDCELISMETSTHTFIANGLISHNSQEHLYIIMHLSGDRQMQRVYIDGEMNRDIHSFAAQMIFGTVTPNTRKIAKTLNYAIAYGATPKTISQQARIPDIKKCYEFLDRWFKTFKEAAEWIKGAQREGLRDGWSLPTLFGRKIRLPEDEGEEGMKSKAINYPVQGSDGEIMKRALIICDRYKLPLAVTVHDSITCDGDVEFPVEELEHIAPVRIPFEVSKTLRWE